MQACAAEDCALHSSVTASLRAWVKMYQAQDSSGTRTPVDTTMGAMYAHGIMNKLQNSFHGHIQNLSGCVNVCSTFHISKHCQRASPTIGPQSRQHCATSSVQVHCKRVRSKSKYAHVKLLAAEDAKKVSKVIVNLTHACLLTLMWGCLHTNKCYPELTYTRVSPTFFSSKVLSEAQAAATTPTIIKLRQLVRQSCLGPDRSLDVGRRAMHAKTHKGRNQGNCMQVLCANTDVRVFLHWSQHHASKEFLRAQAECSKSSLQTLISPISSLKVLSKLLQGSITLLLFCWKKRQML